MRIALTCLASVALLAAWPAQAAAQLAYPLRLTVPDRFQVGETVLPAGTYDVRLLEQDEDVLVVSNPKHQAVVLVQPSPSIAAREPGGNGVRFDRRDGLLVLRQAWDQSGMGVQAFEPATRWRFRVSH